MSFKKRIATHFMLATAIIILFVFGTVYFIVQETVYANLDTDLSFEANSHKSEIDITGDTIRFNNKNEWEEHEHKQVQVNPVFLQIMNGVGEVMDKSPNLKENELSFQAENEFGSHFNASLNDVNVRQVQIPLYYNEELKGFIVAAMSLESSLMVLENLRTTLFILFPIVLLGLFFISSFLAGRSIIPVLDLIETTNRITKYNLNERVALPANADELYELSTAFNSLLTRIENAMERERQFTSDASHELRTPLSVLRGTLEVLIRKPRTQGEYETQIQYSLTEIDRMAQIIDQLLAIARFDSTTEDVPVQLVPLDTLLNEIIGRHKVDLIEKQLVVKMDYLPAGEEQLVQAFYTDLMLDNLVSNAIKYSLPATTLQFEIQKSDHEIRCAITDQGIGIKEEDLTHIFQPFFRSESLNHVHIKGTGLGLSIVEKAAKALGARIEVKSKVGVGTTFTIYFKEILR